MACPLRALARGGEQEAAPGALPGHPEAFPAHQLREHLARFALEHAFLAHLAVHRLRARLGPAAAPAGGQGHAALAGRLADAELAQAARQAQLEQQRAAAELAQARLTTGLEAAKTALREQAALQERLAAAERALLQQRADAEAAQQAQVPG